MISISQDCDVIIPQPSSLFLVLVNVLENDFCFISPKLLCTLALSFPVIPDSGYVGEANKPDSLVSSVTLHDNTIMSCQ